MSFMEDIENAASEAAGGASGVWAREDPGAGGESPGSLGNLFGGDAGFGEDDAFGESSSYESDSEY